METTQLYRYIKFTDKKPDVGNKSYQVRWINSGKIFTSLFINGLFKGVSFLEHNGLEWLEPLPKEDVVSAEEIVEENFKGLEDAMNGSKELSDWYKQLIITCLHEYRNQPTDVTKDECNPRNPNPSAYPSFDKYLKGILQPTDDRLKKAVEEKILCAAIWYKEQTTPKNNPTNIKEGLVLCGHRHGHIISQFTAITGKRSVLPECGEYEQGFLTSTCRFVSRKEAYSIAYNQDQIIGPNKGCSENAVGLTSEDLY